MGQNVEFGRAVVGLHAILRLANVAARLRQLILLSSLGLLALFATFNLAHAQPSGGTISTVTIDGIRYRVHTFTSSGTLHVDQPLENVEYLIVGGGGGGDRGHGVDDAFGGSWGNGGGGGEVVAGGFQGLAPRDFSIIVGRGGQAGGGFDSAGFPILDGAFGGDGDDSSFNGVKARGGKGAIPKAYEPGFGGDNGQGYSGAESDFYASHNGGGGGGADGGTLDQNGGPGRESVLRDGSPVYYGGGGSAFAGGSTENGQTAPGTPGQDGTGAGGGGGDADSSFPGGSGIVVLRYPAAGLVTTQVVASTTLTVGVAFEAFTPVTASGGEAPLTYALRNSTNTADASLPEGLIFSATGEISGLAATASPATTYTVVVTDAEGASSSQSFNLEVRAPPPTLARVDPPTGLTTGGTHVTLTGTGFANVTSVLFGTHALGPDKFTAADGTHITFDTPEGSAGNAKIVIETDHGSADNQTLDAPTFTYYEPSHDASLKSLSDGADTPLNPTFAPDQHDYTQTVADSVDSITLRAEPNDPHATVMITQNGQPVQDPIALNFEHDNAIDITVTAEDGVTKQYYRLKVRRAAPQLIGRVAQAIPTLTVGSKVEAFAPILGSGGIGTLHYRAQDLPKGLSMADNGFVTGTPEEAVLDVVVRVSLIDEASPPTNTVAEFLLTVNKGEQTPLALTPDTSSVAVGGTTIVKVSGGSGTGTLSTQSTQNTCTVGDFNANNQAVVTALAAGECIVTAAKDGDDNYHSATGSVIITIAKPKPVINALSTQTGPRRGSTPVTVMGSGFQSLTPLIVKFGDAEATSTAVKSDSEILVLSPPGPATGGPVFVTVGTGSVVSEITGDSQRFVYDPPSIDATLKSLTSNQGSLDQIFASSTFNYTQTVANSIDTVSVTAEAADALATVVVRKDGIVGSQNIPLGVGKNTITVTVTAEDGTSTQSYALSVFKLPPVPVVTSVETATGNASGYVTGYTKITIHGHDLGAATVVKIGGVDASFTLVSDTEIDAVTPPHAAGSVSVNVTTPGGTSADNALFTYKLLPQHITLNNPGAVQVTDRFTFEAMLDSPLTLSAFSVEGLCHATGAPLEVQFDAPGTCTVTAVQSGNEIYAPASQQVLVTIQAPVITANAGPDQTVEQGTLVRLDGTSSTKPDFDQLTYSWTQDPSDSLQVELSDSSSARASFRAPVIQNGGADQILHFTLTVEDTYHSRSTARVTITTKYVPPELSVVIAEIIPSLNFGSKAGAFKPVTGSGGVGALHYSATGLPKGLTMAEDGVVTGIPAVAVSGQTVTILVLDSAIPAHAGTASFLITVNPSLPGAPSQVSATRNDHAISVSFVAPQSDGGAPIDYFTVKPSPDGAAVQTANGTTTTAVFANLNNGKKYTFVVTAHNRVGDGPASPGSSEVRFGNIPPSIAITSPSSPVAAGETAVLDAAATTDDADQSAELTYSWRQTGGASVTLKGANTSTLSLVAPVVFAPTVLSFELTVTDRDGAASSKSAEVFVASSKPQITASPTDKVAKLGEPVTFNADAKGWTSVRWQSSNGADWTDIADANSAGFAIARAEAGDDGRKFRAAFKNSAGESFTDAAALTVKGSPPVITQNPASQTVDQGETASFTAHAEDFESVQWLVSTTSIDGPYSSVCGLDHFTCGFGNGITYQVQATDQSRNVYYRAKFTNAYGATDSAPAILQVNKSHDATLSGLVSSGGAFNESFAAATTTYTQSVANDVTSVTITATAKGPVQYISFSNAPDQHMKSGDKSTPFALALGLNVISFNVVAEDGTSRTYTIKVTRSEPTVHGILKASTETPIAGQTIQLSFTLNVNFGSLQPYHKFAAVAPMLDLIQLATTPQTSTVNFYDNGDPISGCQNVAVINNLAVCHVTATPGTHEYTATYDGKQVVTGSGASTVVAQVADQSATYAGVVGSFLSDRANQIVTNLPGMDRQIDRLNDAQQQQGGQGSSNFAGDGKVDLLSLDKVDLLRLDKSDLVMPGKSDLALNTSRLGSGPTGGSIAASKSGLSSGSVLGPTSVGQQDMLGFQSFLYNYLRSSGESGNFGHFSFSGPLDVQANFGAGQTRASFKASLSQMMAWADQQDQKEMAALGFGQGGVPHHFMSFDIWTEGLYSSYSGARSGTFGMATLGADYVFSPSFLAGLYGQFDAMDQTSGTPVDGKGWMIGSYATARLGEEVFWQGRAGWGKSSNAITPTPAGADNFTSTRWLVSSSLSGKWKFGDGWAFAPTTTFTYFEDKSDGYVDHFGVAIPIATTRLGQLKLSPELRYGFLTDSDLWVEPSLATELIWNFASTNIDGLGSLDGDATGPQGLRGRIKAGLTVIMPSGIAIGASGSYDGIGANGYSAISGQATVMVPLN